MAQAAEMTLATNGGNGHSLAVRAPQAPPLYDGGLDIITLGDMLAKSGYFADARQTAQAVVKILAGRELGFPAIASMTGIHIIEGKPSVGANLMAARIKGSAKYDYHVVQADDETCILEFFENGQSVGQTTCTIKEATEKGFAMSYDRDNRKWVLKKNWKQFPSDMLFARAISRGLRRYCPDVFQAPVYTPEELLDNTEPGQVPVEAPPVGRQRLHTVPATPEPAEPEGQLSIEVPPEPGLHIALSEEPHSATAPQWSLFSELSEDADKLGLKYSRPKADISEKKMDAGLKALRRQVLKARRETQPTPEPATEETPAWNGENESPSEQRAARKPKTLTQAVDGKRQAATESSDPEGEKLFERSDEPAEQRKTLTAFFAVAGNQQLDTSDKARPARIRAVSEFLADTEDAELAPVKSMNDLPDEVLMFLTAAVERGELVW